MLAPFNPFGFRAFDDDFLPSAAEPAAYARESDTAMLLEMDVPRYRADEIKVTGDGNTGVLTVVGRRAVGAFEDAQGVFPLVLFGQATPTHFSRAFRFARKAYDVTKAAHVVEHGVLRITVPKVPAPPPPTAVTLFDGAHRVAADGTVATVGQDLDDWRVQLMQRAPWPPATKVDESDKQYSYTFELPAEVQPQHLKLELVGSQLVLQVHCTSHPDARAQRSITFSQSFTVPAGTTAERIHTRYEPGKFAIAIDKVPAAPGAAAAPQAVPVSGPK